MALREPGGVGPKMFQTILAVFGPPENVYGASADELIDLPQVSIERAEKILSSQHSVQLMSERIERLSEEGVGVVTYLDDEYPGKLRCMDDPPPVLYFKGTLPDESRGSVCVIGTTTASPEGIEAAVNISEVLVRHDFAVISGLARGIDASAHVGAIKHEGETHAVLGCGLFNIYPEENTSLADQITDRGSILTEFPPDTQVSPGLLISRNRIIVGLSDSAIVVELSPDSPGVQSAAEACEMQGKPLFYLLRGDEDAREIKVPHNAIPFEALEDVETILKSSIGS